MFFVFSSHEHDPRFIKQCYQLIRKEKKKKRDWKLCLFVMAEQNGLDSILWNFKWMDQFVDFR